MKNYEIETSFVDHEGASKTGINFEIFILIFVKNCLYCDAINDFSVWLRTGNNRTDID